MAKRLIDYPELNPVPFVPGDNFTVDVSFIADEDETAFEVSDLFTVAIEWPVNSATDAEYGGAGAVSVAALIAPERGVRVTLVIPASDTELWPVNVKNGICRIMRNGETVAGGELRPSRLARNRD